MAYQHMNGNLAIALTQCLDGLTISRLMNAKLGGTHFALTGMCCYVLPA